MVSAPKLMDLDVSAEADGCLEACLDVWEVIRVWEFVRSSTPGFYSLSLGRSGRGVGNPTICIRQADVWRFGRFGGFGTWFATCTCLEPRGIGGF